MNEPTEKISASVLPLVDSGSARRMDTLLRSPALELFMRENRVPRMRVLPSIKSPMLEREEVFFHSFPHEWPPHMLFAAGKLTLDLSERLLPEGLGLKEATPFSLWFKGPHPQWNDLLSIEKRDPKATTWTAYAQFIRLFVVPLLLNRYFNVPSEVFFLARRTGLDVSEILPMLGWIQRWREPFFSCVTAPAILRKFVGTNASINVRTAKTANQARFALKRLYKHTSRLLALCEPSKAQKSRWSSYLSQELPYSADQFFDKHSFVDRTLAQIKPRSVLDIGCNTGHFSELAAKTGSHVVAIDKDPVVLGKLLHRAIHRQENILPLVVDFSTPSPAVGWRNLQCPSFMKRASQKFDCVMLLALIHHLMYDDGIELNQVMLALDTISLNHVIVEFIGPKDLTVQKLIHSKGLRPVDFNEFEAAFGRRFQILEQKRIIGNDRILYLAKKKDTSLITKTL